ncbi:MAG: VCBS repeat-containing protein [Lewinella sp.]|nr:VCBS repeat-containing protein [Lewinella sp.]
MKNQLRSLFILLLLATSFLLPAQKNISFEKIIIDKTYVSSAITTADIDRDGLQDIIAGDVWYKAPDWERHEIRPLGAYYGTLVDPTRPVGSGARYYARSIGNYTKDVDGDGWLDVLTFNSQGAPCYWYRNPQKNYDQLWQEYLAIELFHNESPQMLDIFGDGEPVVLAGNHIGDGKYTLSWFTPASDPTQLWQPHVIGHPDDFHYSITFRNTSHFAPGGYGHGLGAGDINGDGRQDIITAQGWYEGPENGRTMENWTFHQVPFDTMANPEKIHLLFAQMFAADFDGDGDNDIIGGAAHAYGLWWFEQVQKNGEIAFTPHEISMDMSQLHAMNAVDLDGDGRSEFVTGKRYLAHLGRDPGSSDPAVVAYVSNQIDDAGHVKMTTHLIDDDSGSGTQIWITDLNRDGKPDVLTSNKKGTHLFLQK